MHTMKVGIDSYCYHRFMGGAYPDLERDPGFRLTVFDVPRARALGVDGVSIEACFLAWSRVHGAAASAPAKLSPLQ